MAGRGYFFVTVFVAVVSCVYYLLFKHYLCNVIPKHNTHTLGMVDYNHVEEETSSSVWCFTDNGRKMCTFKNLCYGRREKQFIFVLSSSSVITGINTKEELKSLPLSSVANHNLFFMNIAMVYQEDMLNRKYKRGGHVFLLWRFKWDNIMHVIHDDLLPLYVTYSSICAGRVEECISKYRLTFVDGGELGPLSEWYKQFSILQPQLLHKESGDDVICFDETRTGLLMTSTWFQYGFGVPQGPLINTFIHGSMLRQFSDFVVNAFGLSSSNYVNNHESVVFFSRKLNRRILNEDYVQRAIEDAFHSIQPLQSKLDIINIDISINDTVSILSALVNSKFVVGMHGSAMILCLFLQPGSAVVELFPYAINSESVSPLRALSNIPGMGIIYNYWENMKESNSVPHPDAPRLLGGISHLSVAEQLHIRGIHRVPAVKCCHNAVYLYRMFQDTVVDTNFIEILKQALLKQKHFSLDEFSELYINHIDLQWYFPSPVSNITCTSQNNGFLLVSWSPAINVGKKDLIYNVTVQTSSGVQLSLNSRESSLMLKLPYSLVNVIKVDVWIKSTVQGNESVDVYTECEIDMSVT